MPEILEAAHNLERAVAAHIVGKIDVARGLFASTNLPEIRDWTEKLWGTGSKLYRVVPKTGKAPNSTFNNDLVRMPSQGEKTKIIERDGYHCRFCGNPVMRREIRLRIRTYECYRDIVPWGRSNLSQHAAFQAMWLHYDHIVPHSLGGPSTAENMVVACAPCNCARMENTLEEVGLVDPRNRDPIPSSWNGLEHFR